MIVVKKFLFYLFYPILIIFTIDSFAETTPNYIYLPIPKDLKQEIAANAAPQAPSKIDYTFTNTTFTMENAQQIIAKVFPQNAQEVKDPANFYPLVYPCYNNKLDKMYYHFQPADNPRITYIWFNDVNGQCQFASYYLGTLKQSDGMKRARHCPITNLRLSYLFTPANVSLIIKYEKTGERSPEIGEFMFRTNTCLGFRPLTTENLQALFPQQKHQ